MSKLFLDELRDMISSDDIEGALHRSADFLRGSERELYNEAIHHLGRLKLLNKQRRQGILMPEQYLANRGQIRSAVLEFVDEIEHSSNRLIFPFSRSAVTPRWPASSVLEAIIGADRIKSMAWVHRALKAA